MNHPPEVTHPFDAWVYARLMAGDPVNGELARVSGAGRPLAELLAGLPPGGRRAAWDAHLEGRPDADAWIEAVAAADPDGEAPEPPEAGSGWVPLRLVELPPVEPFPVDVFPEPVRRLVLQGAEAIGCPPDFLALAVLAVAGGVIGRSASLALKDGYFANGCIFAAIIGPPSDGKSPALKMVTDPVRRIDEGLATEWDEAKAQYDRDLAEYEAGKKSAPRGAGGGPAAEPARPVPRRIDIDDATMEVIPVILADNPRGLLMIRDELTALVQGMNQYKGGKGNDRPNALKIWSGDAIKKDRVGNADHAPIRSPFPTLTIVGGLTPDMLGELADPRGRADGFLERFIMAYPDPRPVPEWSEAGLPPGTAEDWAGIVARLWGRRLTLSEGRPCPHVVRLTPAGRAAWVSLYNAHAREMNADDFPPSLRGAWGKFREYAGRLILILALLLYAADPTQDSEPIPEIGPRHVADAWRLVAYFKSHVLRVRAAMRRDGGLGEDAGLILRWIRRDALESFPQSELTRNFPRFRADPGALAAALGALVKANVIRPRPEPTAPKGKRGRKPLPTFDVNPALHAPENCGNCDNSEPDPNWSNSCNSPAPQGDSDLGEVDDAPPVF